MTPRARYERILRQLSGAVAEDPPSAPMGELELQARIAAGEFGLSWAGEDGETVEVIHFGSWNREPGPDFCGARVSIDGVEREGDIEIDPDVRDWDHHGHAGNPAYNQVVLHMFTRRGPRRFFTRTTDHRVVTQVLLSRPRGERRPTAMPAPALDREAAHALILAAAEFRLHRKAERFRRAELLWGRDEALFQSLALGLGYKNNKIPFLLVAQRAGLARAARRHGESVLFGLAGFLTAQDFDRGSAEARAYLRGLWENWWSARDRESRLVLDQGAWKFNALRPANHPHRRLGALAALARAFPAVMEATEPEGFRDVLVSLGHAFWESHYSLRCDRLPRPTALIGNERAGDLVVNALLPSLPFGAAWEHLEKLSAPPPGAKVRRALDWICANPPAKDGRRAVYHQGLLQLHEDFFPREPGEIWRRFTGG